MSEIVEMRPAYCWTCPDCGRDYFERGIVPEMSEEDRSDLQEDFGLEPEEVGEFIMMPDYVDCPECNKEFPTRRFSDTDEEDDDE